MEGENGGDGGEEGRVWGSGRGGSEGCNVFGGKVEEGGVEGVGGGGDEVEVGMGCEGVGGDG